MDDNTVAVTLFMGSFLAIFQCFSVGSGHCLRSHSQDVWFKGLTFP